MKAGAGARAVGANGTLSGPRIGMGGGCGQVGAGGNVSRGGCWGRTEFDVINSTLTMPVAQRCLDPPLFIFFSTHRQY